MFITLRESKSWVQDGRIQGLRREFGCLCDFASGLVGRFISEENGAERDGEIVQKSRHSSGGGLVFSIQHPC